MTVHVQINGSCRILYFLDGRALLEVEGRLRLCFLRLPVRIVTRVPGDGGGRGSLADAEHCLFADF